MIQRTDSFRFPLEVFTELRGGNFDCDNTIKARVAGLYTSPMPPFQMVERIS